LLEIRGAEQNRANGHIAIDNYSFAPALQSFQATGKEASGRNPKWCFNEQAFVIEFVDSVKNADLGRT